MPNDKTQTTPYARPEGSRERMELLAKRIREFLSDINMPGDFDVRARNLVVDLDNERDRKE